MRFANRSSLHRHFRTLHENASRVYVCALCEATFPSASQLNAHLMTHDMEGRDFILIRQMFAGACVVYRKTYSNIRTLEASLYSDGARCVELMSFEATRKKSVKFNVVLTVNYIKLDDKGEEISNIVHFVRSPTFPLTEERNYEEIYTIAAQKIELVVQDFL